VPRAQNRQQQIENVRKKRRPTGAFRYTRPRRDAIHEEVSTNTVGPVKPILHRVLQF
jgi:hypothetical protein